MNGLWYRFVLDPVELRVGFALGLSGGVRVAVYDPMTGSDAPWDAVSTLRSASSGAAKTADWLALLWLPTSQFTFISGVESLLPPLIVSDALAVLCVCLLASTDRLSSGVTSR